MTKMKVAVTGIGTILAAGAAFIAWKKSGKLRAWLTDWKKQRLENAYYASRDEKDIAWG